MNTFIARWNGVSAGERKTAQLFFAEFCDALEVPRPAPDRTSQLGFGFEREVEIPHGDGQVTVRRIDFYKRGSFILEAKQAAEECEPRRGMARRGTTAWDRAMRKAW